MKNILGIFAIFILPIYFIVAAHISPNAAEQIAIVETTTTTTEQVKPVTEVQKNKKFKKLDNSPATQEKVKQFRTTLPEKVLKEVENFRAERLKLREAGEKLYNDLSVEAKTALKDERQIRLNKK
jgi:hypothetical protein